MQVPGQEGINRNPASEDVMKANANTANLRAYAVAAPADLAGAARVAKNLALFAVAPFIGLAYAAAFPFVAVGLAVWYGTKALLRKGGAA
jgi:hypothetical protein